MIIDRKLKQEIIEHCLREFPLEACGLLSGKGYKVSKVYPMTNTDKSGATFFMEPEEQLKVMKEIRNNGEELIGIYHSHVASAASPSKRDIEMAFYPDVSYLIVSLMDRKNPDIRAFRIVDGKVKEEEIQIG